ncbi:unnamed protein product [Rotaria socialis]|uniref:Uncharacterized protein n=1 Tax=Rotaria socialis TaxID=392032 RepID=A0A818QQ84_9BILA|nr:unnamed protein product [Rotaria socialis]CAF4892781.1 unnamed protein product [Rotaria socialis]
MKFFFEIFEYLDTYHAYKGFYYLNKRFENLFTNSNHPTKIEFSTMSRSNFKNYYIDIILPHRYQIKLLHLSNPFSVNAIFSPPNIISEFSCLETLILDNLESKYLDEILNYLTFLPKFHSFTISFANPIECLSHLFTKIVSLSKLKYFKMTYQTKDDCILSIHFPENDRSSIEYLIINGHFLFKSLNNLFRCFPQLHHLSMDSMVTFHSNNMNEELPLIELKHLTYVSFKFEHIINFYDFEKIIKKFFYYVETLRLTVKDDETYLHAKRWQTLITSSMPHLRVFDMNHSIDIEDYDDRDYHSLVSSFYSSFWRERQWHFLHRHEWSALGPDKRVLSSSNLHRTQYYRLDLLYDYCNFGMFTEMNLNLVKHVYTDEILTLIRSKNYFPNVIQLTILSSFKISDDSILPIINHLIPLNQLTQINFLSTCDLLNGLLKLLCFTSNLNSLTFNSLLMGECTVKLLPQNEKFQYIASANKIKNLHILHKCSLANLQLLANLFSKVEYLKIEIIEEQITDIIRFLLIKHNHILQNLFLLCISQSSIKYLEHFNNLIRSECLINDYFIKYVNDDLYLWW